MTIIEPEQVSYEEAAGRGLDRLLGDASDHPIAVDTGRGAVVLVSAEVAESLISALGELDDVYDRVLAVSRVATDNGRRHPLKDVIEELGFTQAEIDAAND